MKNSLLSEIKIVGFDFDDTLVDERFSLQSRWEQTQEQFLLPDAIIKKLLPTLATSGVHYLPHVYTTLGESGYGLDSTKKIVEYFLSTHGEEVVHKSVREIITLFKQKGLRVGVLTDGRQDYQEGRLKRAGIYDLFDFFYYGDSEQKPDPMFFRQCIKNEGVGPHEFLYVGDHIVKDIEGALTVGARTCWISGKDTTISIPKGTIAFKTMHDFYQYLQRT